MKVSIAVRQKFHGFQLAQQLQNHNSLLKLYTAHYGPILGKDNSVGFSIAKERITTNIYSALLTYGFKNNGFNNDNYFGKWVADKLNDENIIVTWGIQALPIIQKAKELGIKVVLERGSAHANTQKDLLLEEYRSLKISTRGLEKSFSTRRMERELMEYELADVVSIPSSFVKRTFLHNGFTAEKLFVNAYGANLRYFTYQPQPHQPFRIIYAGTLSIRKGIQYLLSAFSALKLSNAELWLVGRVEPEIKTFLSRYVEENIKILDPVPQHLLSELYNLCDVFAICSIEEGMAMVQPQAMACGLPLICTTNTGGEDLITEGIEGYVLPIRDTEKLKEAIFILYADKNKRMEMGQRALRKVSNDFTWADYGQRAVNFYKKLTCE